jgi:16S rRNA (guanine966-N2)-methyltransferase
MLRVIAGEHRGRRLRAPAGLGTRPTADRVRQALFNILPPPAPGSVALDLYAGSGALGIEALSRGAAAAVFVDADPAACAVLRANLRALGLGGRAVVLAQRVERVLARLLDAGLAPGGTAPPYSYVFADPPYKDVASQVPALLHFFFTHQATLLGPHGLLVIEHDRRTELAGELPRVDARRYGDTALSFFAAPQAEPTSHDLQPGDPP